MQRLLLSVALAIAIGILLDFGRSQSSRCSANVLGDKLSA
jgi:hypothetical protein